MPRIALNKDWKPEEMTESLSEIADKLDNFKIHDNPIEKKKKETTSWMVGAEESYSSINNYAKLSVLGIL